MSGNSVALDTNRAIAVLNDREGAGDWVRQFDQIFLPVPVLGELRFGMLNSQRVSENIVKLETFCSRCTILDVTASTTDAYARIRIELKAAGKPIPENDIWIAAICREHNLALATSDTHFSLVQNLRFGPAL